MIERFGAFAVGIALVAAAIFVPGVLNAGAVPVVLVIAGGGLLVWAFVAERPKAFGPKGLELFRAAREQTAQTAPTPEAAAEIRATQSPEEFADVIGKLLKRVDQLERSETPAERDRRIREDDRIRAVRARYNQGSRDLYGVA